MKPQQHLCVHIVEQHNDVVTFIHRAIASKKLPFSGVPIIHLDSHPDLLIPIHLDADTVFKPAELYEALSIENWLLPLAYAKHIDHVIWVKPPWANQIKASQQYFHLGKCNETGKLRLSCKENYFLTDGLFCSACDMSNGTECKLTVVELMPPKWKDLEPFPPEAILAHKKNTELKSADHEECVTTEHSTKDSKNYSRISEIGDENETMYSDYEKWTNHLRDVVTTEPYILDIDLDFFSTKNPFKELFDSEKEVLKQVFKCPPLISSSDEDVETYTLLRQQQIHQLEVLFSALDNKWSERDNGASISPDQLSSQSLTDLSELNADDLDCLSTEVQQILHTLCLELLPDLERRQITFLQLFDFGCTLDDTELPHHISTWPQVQALVDSFTQVLAGLPKPALVTISRSSHDEYCPPDQVDQIEAMVLKILSDAYGKLNISRNYEDD